MSPRLNGGGGNLDGTESDPNDTPPTAPVNKVCNVPEVLTKTFYPGEQTTHGNNGGVANGKAWRSSGVNAETFATFGPYIRNVPKGVIKVTFRLKLTTTVALDDKDILYLDVFSLDNQGSYLGGRTLRRRDFAQSGVSQDFPVYFYNHGYCDRGLEFRLYWFGRPAGDPDLTSTIVDHESTTYEALGTGGVSFVSAGTALPLPSHVMNFMPNKTVATWFKTSVNSGVILGSANEYYPATPIAWVPMLYIDRSGRLRGCFWVRGPSDCDQMSPVAVNDNKWHHAALVVEGAVQRLYLDGVLVVSRANAATVNSGAGRIQWGLGYTLSWPDASAVGWEQFVGQLRDNIFFTAVLNATQITELMNTSRP